MTNLVYTRVSTDEQSTQRQTHLLADAGLTAGADGVRVFSVRSYWTPKMNNIAIQSAESRSRMSTGPMSPPVSPYLVISSPAGPQCSIRFKSPSLVDADRQGRR